MADHDHEARLRDLKNRVEREPRSRFFVPLAEEYRKADRLPDAIKALENGLESHPGYVAARVALARALLEAGRIDDSVAAFSKVLADDPSNLVAAKALGDIHLSRGEPMEALKRYLRFRAVSGDRRLDEVIAKLRAETAPAPEATVAPVVAPPVLALPAPPPPAFPAPVRIARTEAPAEPPRLVSPLPPIDLWPPSAPRRETDPFDITSVPYRPAPAPEAGSIVSEPAEQMLSRDVSLAAISSREPSPPDGDISAPRLRLPEANWPFESAPPRAQEAEAPAEPPADAEASAVEVGASGRTLAELYFEQGHDAEAIRLADELLVAIPGDEGLERLRSEATDRLAAASGAGEPLAMPPALEDPGRERRLAKIELLNQWLAAVAERNRP